MRPDLRYASFLASKRPSSATHGRDADPAEVHGALFDWQRDVVLWALRLGRAAIFADTGLGKSLMALEWARLTDERALILTPLAVAPQFQQIAAQHLDLKVTVCRGQDDVQPGINVANYERLHSRVTIWKDPVQEMQYEARPHAELAAKQPGRHRWIATGAWVLSDEAVRGAHDPDLPKLLDNENLMFIGIGCYDCEQPLQLVGVDSACSAEASP